MEFTAAFVNPPKAGKKQGTIKTSDGKMIGFFPDKFVFVAGHRYDCTVSEREYQGKTFYSVESQKDITPSGGNGAAPGGGGGDRFYMPFVSNVVAHAIAAGRIEGPADIQAWAQAAKAAAVALDAKPLTDEDLDF